MVDRSVIDRIVEEHGGECLSTTERVRASTALAFMCARGHRWDALASTIAGGAWCPECTETRRKRYSIADMQRLAEERGGVCLSKRWNGAVSPLWWRCARGHRWRMNPHNLLYSGTWCRECERAERLEQLDELVRGHGGELLSRKYIDGRAPLRVRCAKGHAWKTTGSNLRRGSWCERCAGREPVTLARLHRAARARGGESLETEESALHVDRHARWRCAEGHEWTASPANVMSGGTWCPYCQKRAKKTLADVDAHAAARGGRCLTRNYENSHQLLDWECAEGHRWASTRHRVMNRGHWCPTCAGVARGTVEQMQELAARRGGTCLSRSYQNTRTPLQWRCAAGHVFTLAPKIAKSGRWCRHCARTNEANQHSAPL